MNAIKPLAMAIVAAAFLAVPVSLTAQPGPPGRRNFDPAQFRARMMQRMRDEFGVKNDDEWKIISDRISKVMEARRGLGPTGFGMFGRRFRRPPGNQNNGNANRPRRNFRRFGPQPSPEAEALQQAIENKASTDVIKAKLEAFRQSRKEKEAKLKEAQDQLRQVLDVRQEAIAALMDLVQ